MSKTGQDIPQGQPQDVIGGGIDGSVVKQLIAREKLVSTPKKDKINYYSLTEMELGRDWYLVSIL